MTGFLDLPSELLFEIIGLVVSSPYPYPSNGTRQRPKREGYYGRHVTCFPSPDIVPIPNALNLLLTCQKLYSETMLYLTKKPQTVKLDIAIVDNHWIWPTWRTVPIKSMNNVVDRVDIELILCCTESERHLQTQRWSWEMSRVTNTEFERLHRHVMQLCNPGYAHINMVRINIDTTRYSPSNEVISNEEIPCRRIEGLFSLDFEKLYPIHRDNSIIFHINLRAHIYDVLEPETNFNVLAKHQLRGYAFDIDGGEIGEENYL